MRYECDLHCHTTRSDGKDSPKELIENAANAGLKVVAITDHDIQPPFFIENDDGKIDINIFASKNNIELVMGYEFSCDTYVDDVHILGYRMNWESTFLKEEVERAKRSKSEAYRKLCDLLASKGMPVDYEREILRYINDKGEIKDRDSDEVQRKHIFEIMAQKGYAPTWKDAKILVRDDPELNVRRRKIEPFDAIDLIKSCGGTAVLAHPFLIDEVIQYADGRNVLRNAYINKLINHGLDGMEACYPYSKTSYKGTLKDLEIERYIKNEYLDKVKFFTGGSDYHAEYKTVAGNPRFLGESGISLRRFEAIREYLI